MARAAALALAFLALMAGPAQGSAPPGSTSRLLARDHAAPETTLALAKAIQPWPRTSAPSDLVLATEELGSATGRGTADFEVVVVPGFTLDDLEEAQGLGAVGLLNPGAGPETSAELAEGSLVRGEVRNSLRDGLPPEPPQLSFTRGELGSADGPAIYLGLPEGGRQSNDSRYPILVVGPGFEGLLSSDSTRIPGLVSVADVAPTALGREGGLESKPGEAGVAELRELDDRIRSNGDVRLAATILVCALVLGLALFAPATAVPGLAAALLANLALGILDVSDFWTVLAVLGVAVALGGPVLAALFRPPLALGLLLVAVVAAYLVALAADGATVALSPLGPSQNARYFGLSNLLETMLLLPALGGAVLLHRRLGWVAFAGVALLTFVTVAGNRFGADGGGAIVLAVGFAVLGVLLAGARWRALVVALAGAAALTAGLVALDVATGGESHVTEALGDGPVELARDLGERISLSFARATQDWYVGLLLALLLLALGLLVARTVARRGVGSETAVPLALAAALAASLVVNDSPNDVLLVGVVSYLAADVGMLPARWPVSSRSSSPFSRSPWPRAAAAERSPRRRPRP